MLHSLLPKAHHRFLSLAEPEAAYVASVLTLYADLPATPCRPGPGDQSLARRFHHEQIPLPLIESAFLLGTLRRLARPDNPPPLTRIRSLAYFLPVIAELQQEPLPAGYLDYLRRKLQRVAKAALECLCDAYRQSPASNSMN